MHQQAKLLQKQLDQSSSVTAFFGAWLPTSTYLEATMYLTLQPLSFDKEVKAGNNSSLVCSFDKRFASATKTSTVKRRTES